jgi:chemotaxis signal transduction protein
MATDETSIDGASGAAPFDRRPRIALRPHLALPWLVLPEGLPLQMLMDALPVRVPNTRPWFHGVLSQRGNLLPVFDLGHWAGLAPTDRRQAHFVAIGQGANACALLCASAPGLVTTTGDSPEQSDAGTLAPYLGTATASSYGPVYEFDAYRWLADASQHVASSAVLNPTH